MGGVSKKENRAGTSLKKNKLFGCFSCVGCEQHGKRKFCEYFDGCPPVLVADNTRERENFVEKVLSGCSVI